ncbi:MAG: GNAT family N-acetyltransferase [Lachnospiraceae bacterium]|nr:GNAT family N-acetyltransferase [Lachnospiraceae bacterium]
MKLREYRAEDSAIICSWIKDEESLFKWSADRIGKFPLEGDELNKEYAKGLRRGSHFPLTAVDDDDVPVGHMFIRYPDLNDRSRVRFGFVIVSPELRGKGYGKQMLELAKAYAKEVLKAEKITLGVFANNDSARHCYEAVGFRPVGSEMYKMSVGEWECIEMMMELRA